MIPGQHFAIKYGIVNSWFDSGNCPPNLDCAIQTQVSFLRNICLDIRLQNCINMKLLRNSYLERMRVWSTNECCPRNHFIGVRPPIFGGIFKGHIVFVQRGE